MTPTGFFIDANLLVLFVVGSVDRELIRKHRRLQRFSIKDYDRLIDAIDAVARYT